MQLSKVTLDDLRAEVGRLRARTMAILEILGEATKEVLNEATERAETRAKPRRRRRRKGAVRKPSAIRERPGKRERSGFGQILESTVAANPGLGPSAIAEKIKEGGVKYRGKTPLKQRVGGDLRRLVKRGKIKSRKSKYFPVGK